jgi:hypothetical protein
MALDDVDNVDARKEFLDEGVWNHASWIRLADKECNGHKTNYRKSDEIFPAFRITPLPVLSLPIQTPVPCLHVRQVWASILP